MINIFTRFLRHRRGAIALIFAGSLLPLVMLVGLSIDYSFYVQARSQFALASDASATYAIREATAAYALDSATETNAAATSDAQTGGDAAGKAWFTSQLATLPTASIQNGTPSVNVIANTGLQPTNPVGFTATVSYAGLYPPFFNGLFKRTSQWTVSGTSSANSQYSYVELLLLLDTSGSMLVSADLGNNSAVSSSNPGGILTMDDNTVCIPNAYLSDTSGISGIGVYSDPSQIVTWADVQNLASPADTGLNAQCATGTNAAGQTPYITTTTVTTQVATTNTRNHTTTTSTSTSTSTAGAETAADPTSSTTTQTTTSGHTSTTTTTTTATNTAGRTGGGAFAPCAFACHTTTSTYSAPGFTYSGGLLASTASGTYTGDLYGLARKLGVLLKTDVVFQSTESILNTMIDSNQAPNQFTVGVYSFNDDVCPIVQGGSGDTLPEATANLSSALADVKAIDYTQNPAETAYPPITPNEHNDFTNFPFSVSDLIAGKFGCDGSGGAVTTSTGTALQAAAPTGTTPGNTAQYPEKDIFIVTDGMEDSGTNSSTESTSAACGRVLGEMTGIASESSKSTTSCDQAVCEPLKKLGFTVYVLDITYPAVEVQFYYNNQPRSDQYIADDFGTISGVTYASGGTAQVWNEGVSTNGYGVSTTLTTPSPDQQALQACASSPSDFYQASSSTAIQTAMSQMLKSALDSAIRITQ